MGTSPQKDGGGATSGVALLQEVGGSEPHKKKQCAKDSVQEAVCKGQCAQSANPNQTNT